MDASHFRTLFDYDAWARDRLLAAVAQLSEPAYLAPRPLDRGSIHGTLVHTYAAAVVWLSRWQGASPQRMLDSDDLPGLAALQEGWREFDRQLTAFLAGTEDTQLDTAVDYRNTLGEPWRRPLWQLMAHLINHSTQHRSEVATAVTQLGHSPGDLDLIAFLNQRAV